MPVADQTVADPNFVNELGIRWHRNLLSAGT